MKYILILTILLIVSYVNGFEINSVPNQLVINAIGADKIPKWMVINIDTGIYNSGNGFVKQISSDDLKQLKGFNLGSLNPLNYYGGVLPPAISATFVAQGKYIQFDPTRTGLPNICYFIASLVQKYS